MTHVPMLSDLFGFHQCLPNHGGLIQQLPLNLLEDRPSVVPNLHLHVQPWKNLLARESSGLSSIQSDKNEFRVNLDVQQFKPEELTVKVSEDGYLVVEGKHEERPDEHGFISRQFTRRYKIPEEVDQTALVSNLSSDGVLSLKAPKKVLPEAAGREIPITRTQQPAVQQPAERKRTSEKSQ